MFFHPLYDRTNLIIALYDLTKKPLPSAKTSTLFTMDSKDTSLDAYIARMAAAYRPRSSAPPSPSESHFTEAHKLEEALLEEALIRQALGDIAGDPDRLSPSRLRNSIDRVRAEKYDHNKVPGLIADTNETASSPRSGRSTSAS